MKYVYARSATAGPVDLLDLLVARWAGSVSAESLTCQSDSIELVDALDTELRGMEGDLRVVCTAVPRASSGDRALAWKAVTLAVAEDSPIICRGLVLARAVAGNAQMAGRMVVCLDEQEWAAFRSNAAYAQSALQAAALVLVTPDIHESVDSSEWVNGARLWPLMEGGPTDVLTDLNGGAEVPAQLRLETALAARLLVEIGVGSQHTSSSSQTWSLQDCRVRIDHDGDQSTVTFEVRPTSAWGTDTAGRKLWRVKRIAEAWGLAALVTSDVAVAAYAAAHPDMRSRTWLLVPDTARTSWTSQDWDTFADCAQKLNRILVDRSDELKYLELRFPQVVGRLNLIPATTNDAPTSGRASLATRYGSIRSQLVVGTHRSRLLVVGHDMKFANPILEYLRRREGLDVADYSWTSQHHTQPTELASAVADRDVVWVEFASGAAEWHAANKGDHHLVVRVHGYEVNGPWGDGIDFSQVDVVVFPSEHLRAKAVTRWSLDPARTRVIPNPVDHWHLHRPKTAQARHTLGLLGWSPGLKRFDRAVSLLRELLQTDERWMLSVKGMSPQSLEWVWSDPDQRAMFDGVFAAIRTDTDLASHIFIEDAGPDVPAWFTGVGWILSPSDHESFHLAPVEGMASGSVPVVWARDGAADIFPEPFLVNDVAEAAEFILTASSSDRFDGYAALAEHAVAHLDLPSVVDRWADVLQVGRGRWA
ncbi:glycosyltransferase family protein [Pedococcus soli]